MSLLKRAAHERQTLGYITARTRDALNDVGYTAAQIESALINMESTNG